MRKSRQINSDNDIPMMMYTIHHWLNYTNQVSRIDLLAESSIIYPTMEYIERNTGNSTCYMEREYDEFTDTKFINNKYLDLMFEGEKFNFLMEFKYVSKSTNNEDEKQRYFNDIVRLGLALKNIKEKDKKTRCYFVVCGQLEWFNKSLFSQSTTTKSNSFDKTNTNENILDPHNEFNMWIALEEKPKDSYRTIDISEPKFRTRYVKFILEYFKGNKKEKIDDDQEKELLLSEFKDRFSPTLYTKRIRLLKGNDSEGQILGIWEVLLDKE